MVFVLKRVSRVEHCAVNSFLARLDELILLSYHMKKYCQSVSYDKAWNVCNYHVVY